MSGGGGSNWNPGDALRQLSQNAGEGIGAIGNNFTQGWQGLTSGKGTPWGPLGDRTFTLQGPGGTSNQESLATPWQLGTDIAQNTLNGAAQLDPLTHVPVTGMPNDFSGLGLAPENYVDKALQGPTNLANLGTTSAIQDISSEVMDKLGMGAGGQALNPYNPSNQDNNYNSQKLSQQAKEAQAASAARQQAQNAARQAQIDAQTASNQGNFNSANSFEDALRAAYLQRQGSKANANGFY